MKNKLKLKTLFWIDAITAIISGTIVLVFLSVLSNLFILPVNLLMTLSYISFWYAGIALYLAIKSNAFNNQMFVIVFVWLNWCWVFSCIVLLMKHVNTAASLGILYLSIQIIFVAALTVLQQQKIKEEIN